MLEKTTLYNRAFADEQISVHHRPQAIKYLFNQTDSRLKQITPALYITASGVMYGSKIIVSDQGTTDKLQVSNNARPMRGEAGRNRDHSIENNIQRD